MARFNPHGVEKWKLLPAVASLAAPSRAEITAGVDLTPDIDTITGFGYKNTPYKTPDIASDFESEVSGQNAADPSSLKMWLDDASATLRTAQAKGTAGFMVRMPFGDVPTKLCEVWPCRVNSNNLDPTGNAASSYTVSYSLTSKPAQNAVVPS